MTTVYINFGGEYINVTDYVLEVGSISKSIESDKLGDAGVITIDNVSLTILNTGDVIGNHFNDLLTDDFSSEIYWCQIYQYSNLVFTGMIDFGTVNFNQTEMTVTFDVIDLLASINLINNATYYQSRSHEHFQRILDTDYFGVRRVEGNSNLQIIAYNEDVEQIEHHTSNLSYCANGNILFCYGLDNKYLGCIIVTDAIPGAHEDYATYYGIVFHYWANFTIPAATENATGIKNIISFGVTYNGIDIYNYSIYNNGNVPSSFNAIKLIHSICVNHHHGIMTNLVSNVPDYSTSNCEAAVLSFDWASSLLSKMPLDRDPYAALQWLANTYNYYIFIDGSGTICVYDRGLVFGATVAQYVIYEHLIANYTTSLFWDKIVDEVIVTCDSQYLWAANDDVYYKVKEGEGDYILCNAWQYHYVMGVPYRFVGSNKGNYMKEGLVPNEKASWDYFKNVYGDDSEAITHLNIQPKNAMEFTIFYEDTKDANALTNSAIIVKLKEICLAKANQLLAVYGRRRQSMEVTFILPNVQPEHGESPETWQNFPYLWKPSDIVKFNEKEGSWVDGVWVEELWVIEKMDLDLVNSTMNLSLVSVKSWVYQPSSGILYKVD